ncbi:MAG: hypothetical protein ACFFAS_21305, partial [Promethearchaeota archaeon]
MSTMTTPLIIIPYTSTATEYRFATGWGCSLMLGWTALLLWGFFKPIERRSIFLLTIFPVVSGLILTELIVAPIELMNLWLAQIFGCFSVCFIGYFFAVNLKKK